MSRGNRNNNGYLSHKDNELEKKTKVKRFYDSNLLIDVMVIVCFGLIMLFSASAYSSDTKFQDTGYFFIKQSLFALIGTICMVGASFIPYKIYKNLSWFLYFTSIILMILVKSPLGYESHNARRWIKIGQITFQPSEIAKIAIILLVPLIIEFFRQNKYKVELKIIVFVIEMIPAFVAWKFTDNLSTGIIIALIVISLHLISHKHPIKTTIFLILLCIIAYFLLYRYSINLAMETVDDATIESFRKRRLLAWANPYKFISGVGWQVVQGLYAIGSGGILGKGLGQSTQKLCNIPEAQNDFIFPIICEELGFFGALIVIMIFAFILFRLVIIAYNVKDNYAMYVVMGIFFHICIQVMLNLCVILNLIPTSGVSLPFISSGGTALIITMAEMGIALSISRTIIINDYK